MSRFTAVAGALALLSSSAFCGDVSVTIRGTVSNDLYNFGPVGSAQLGDPVVVTFEVDLPGMVAGQVATYAMDTATFAIDINGPIAGSPSGAADVSFEDDNPADGFDVGTPLTTGDFFGCEFDALAGLFSSNDVSLLQGTYDVAASVTSQNMRFSGAGGFLGISVDTLEIAVPQFICIEITGTVASNSYAAGPFAGAAISDTAVMTFNVSTQGVPVAPGQLVNYPVDVTSFTMDINGPTGAVLTGSANFGVQNNFPATDGVRNLGGTFATGETFAFEFGAGGSFFGSVDITQVVGIYNIAANRTSFDWTTTGGGGLMEIFPETMVIKFPAGNFNSFCNGDGGNQLGCTDCPCGNNAPMGTIGGCLNSAGTSANLIASGSQSVSLPSGDTTDLRFALSGAPAGAFCILNSGDAVAPTSMANPCFGLNSGAQAAVFDGLRCAVMNTRRHGGRSADGNGDVGLTHLPWGGEGNPAAGLAVAGGGFAAGQTRFFQVINRDDPLAVCGRGLNTSQAVEVTFTP